MQRRCYPSLRRLRGALRRRVDQRLGGRDLALDGGQVAVDVNASLARVLVDLLEPPAPRPARLAGQLVRLDDFPPAPGLRRVLALELLGDRLRLDVGAVR
jgi:hypothetical protein